MFENISTWLSQPTIYIVIGAISVFILSKLLVSFGVYLFKKYIIKADKPK